jgi:hypothetical protein
MLGEDKDSFFFFSFASLSIQLPGRLRRKDRASELN